jgi:kynureninase
MAPSRLFDFQAGEAFAMAQDANDPLARFRGEFLIPTMDRGEPCLYFLGNSLGPQPRRAREAMNRVLEDWARLGVEAHFEGRDPWLGHHRELAHMSAALVGAKPIEVALMNTTSVNLHLMMVSFYRPEPERHRILIESPAFPSDEYAVASQACFHGFDPRTAVIHAAPRPGQFTLRTDDLLELIERAGDRIALLLLGHCNYATGQAFQVAAITRAAHAKGCLVGLDLAHAVGNVPLALHDWNVDFAVWCSYKYLNAGPGAVAGCFVHERHARSFDLPRFAGWWGHDEQTRFQMPPRFDPQPGAQGWQLSNPSVLQLAALRASLEIFEAATMPAIREKSIRLTGYLEFLLERLPAGFARVITPREPGERGAQLSIKVPGDARALLRRLAAEGAMCDFREPDIIRAAPAPLFCSYLDVYRFGELMARLATAQQAC